MSFTPNIPSVGQKLGASRQQVLNNFASLRSTIAVDHIDVNLANAGKHKVLHLQNNVNDPVDSINNFGELYSKGINSIATDIALFYRAGNTGIPPIQMTMNVAPKTNTNGYTFLPGGILVQWGQITATNSTFQTLTFSTNNIAFPNNCFTVFTQLYGSGTPPSGNGNVEIRKTTISKLMFEWCVVTSSSQYTGFYWVAIGN